jgi:8-oxo-dGTP pyrophosphatase MutT (NUDIX family)
LRKPANNFEGYAWTFPKGRQDPGEKPDVTALREVKEETGYSAVILCKTPGSFEGDTTVTEYFLLHPAWSKNSNEALTTGITRFTNEGFPESRPILYARNSCPAETEFRWMRTP